MENGNNFTEALFQAIDAKAQWYDTEELPRLLDNYRLLHTCIKVIFDFLVNKALITPDPYKLDKKISDIKSPDSEQFVENERSVIMGQRFSDYESTLDFLCNYYKFSVSQLSLGNVKKLMDLNNSINWSSFSGNSNKINTRVLATLVFQARQNSEAITASMVNDNLSKAAQTLNEINSCLKEYTDFQKEWYKAQVRKNVMSAPGFDANKAMSEPASELQQIKKNFSAGMGKVPFYGELIAEIIQEDQGEKKLARQAALLAKLNVQKTSSKKQEKKIDTKALIMDSLLVLGATPAQISTIAQKIQENHDLLLSEHNSFMDKLKRYLKRAFGIAEKPLYYTITIVDQTTGAKRTDKLNYQTLMTDLATKTRRYSTVAQKTAPGYQKILSMPEEKIAEFVSMQISECNKMIIILNSLDDFFKAAASPANKTKVKGLKIDITTFKNSVIKANQYRAEYTSYIEEAEQMRKLGISE